MIPYTHSTIQRSGRGVQTSASNFILRHNWLFLATTSLVLLLCLVQTGCVGLTSAAKSANASPTSDTAPSIAAEPISLSVVAGQPATFTIAVSGTAPFTFQWRKNGTNISGATGSNYTMPATAPSDNGSAFSVVVSNTAGNITSNAAMLTVMTQPSITTQPVSESVTTGQTATFSVTASGTSPFTYQWSKGGAAISGATASSYTTPATTTSDNGSIFSVVITNSAGNVTSSAATLTVTATATKPSITTQPANQSVTSGQTATFSVVASGTSPFTYQWSKGGAAISGATASSYTTPATTTSDSGSTFSVVVTNSAGNAASNAATLTVTAAVTKPSITTEPANQSVTSGQTATFSVAASGTAPFTYQWSKGGAAISGATASSYTTPATVLADNGAQFTAVVTNSAGTASSSAATLTVTAAATRPSITTQPASKTVTSGQTATFSVVASGTAPMTYQWSKGGAAISGATASSYTTPATTPSDNGSQFTVVVTNSAGTASSNAATLTVSSVGQLSANTNSLNFGNVSTSGSSSLPVIITNIGGSTVTISNVSIALGPGITASGVSTGQMLTAGQSTTLNVTFAPSSTVTLNGSVTITSNATPTTLAITLLGAGVAPVSHSATLTWTASTSAASGYNVYRGGVSGGPYALLNSSLVTPLTYTDSTVQSGQTYFYVVTAVDSTGTESDFSTQASGVIPTP